MKSAWVVVGLSHGDEGKGSVVDSLVRKTGSKIVIRFNGGAQAAHNVISPEGRHHTFSQWGAGTLAGARTVLTKDFIMSPLAMQQEGKHLQEIGVADPMSLITVDERALLTTPYHGAMNRIRELARGGGAHGSCGVGVGEAVADSLAEGKEACLRAGDLLSESSLRRKLDVLRRAKFFEATSLISSKDMPGGTFSKQLTAMFDLSGAAVFEKMIALMLDVGKQIKILPFDGIASSLGDSTLVLEGAQGVLLDEWHGFHPHTTWSTSTSENARAFLAVVGGYDATVLGVTRWYATRHGAGPFPTELGVGAPPGEHNAAHPWQGEFRVGWFDAVATKYAIESDGCIDAVAVTCCDQKWPEPARVCVGYDSDHGRVLKLKARRDHAKDAARLDEQQRLGEFLRAVRPVYERLSDPSDVARLLGKPLMVTSSGPASEHKTWFDERRDRKEARR